MKRYEIRPVTDADRDEVVALQDTLARGGPEGTASHLDWKYRRNPYLDGRYSVVGRCDGRLAGMVGVFGSRWEVGGERFTLPCLSDTVVYPEHRGGPLFTAMLDEVVALLRADGVPWVLDFGDQGAGPAMLLRGWREVGPWTQAALTREKAVLSEVEWQGRSAVRGPRSGLPLRFLPAHDTSGMAEVVRRLPADGRLRVDRGEEYFRWRASNPLARYFHLVAGEGTPEGYLIGHRSGVDAEDGGTPTTVVDVEATSDEVFADLVATAYEQLPGWEVLLWTRDLPSERVAVLLELGARLRPPTGRFTSDMFLPNLMVRRTGAPVPAALAELDRPETWDLRGVCGRAWR